jgi:hypothetical protein
MIIITERENWNTTRNFLRGEDLDIFESLKMVTGLNAERKNAG